MLAIKDNFTITPAIVPGAIIKTTQTSSAIDLSNAQSNLIVFASGAITDGTYTPSLTECATSGGTFTAVDPSNIVGDTSALTASSVRKISYIGSMQYIKTVLTATGSPATGGYFGASVIAGMRKLPAA